MKRMVMFALAAATTVGGGPAWAQAPAGSSSGATPAPPAPYQAPTPADTPTPSPSAAPPAPPASATAAPSTATLDAINNAKLTDTGAKDGVDPSILRAEVMLDRVHASPGVIDGRDGENFQHALEIFEATHDLPTTKALDEKTWASLLKESGSPVLAAHTLTADDVKGPFFPDIPKDYAKQAEMKTLGYRSVAQKLGAQFHMGEDLLAELNPGVDLSKAGNTILVAVVTPEPIHDTLHEIVVDKGKSQVLGLDKRGRVVVAYPATIGSEELPSPSGTYKVKGVAHHPVYYYNPKNFVQGHNKEKLQLPPGPNNPVGDVFIALTKPTYGLHGTPDPSKIDKTASHGCVRMTNWDATALSHLVRPGMVVSFRKSFHG